MAEIKFTRPIREALDSLIENSKVKKPTKRIPNAFILFRKVYTLELSLRNCHMKANEISKLCAVYWKNLPDVTKHEFEQISKELRNNAQNKTPKKLETSKYKFKFETPNSLYRKTIMRKPSNSRSSHKNSNHNNHLKNTVISNDKSKETYITDKDGPASEIMKNFSANSSEIIAEIIPSTPFLQNLTTITPFHDILNEESQSFFHMFEYNMGPHHDCYYNEDQLLEISWQPNLTTSILPFDDESQVIPHVFGNYMDLDQSDNDSYYHYDQASPTKGINVKIIPYASEKNGYNQSTHLESSH
ncbi:8542_t:CDS:1 [Ambispora leptoticha]|uniref:8542_t:CDS:1 n=1 Tax=Ambispora leptoticha TaxID=144679 RepID=A0A9N9C951_9GLOM|nr:8542_t:CDS:1 [Ambispora leptoticha]